MSSFVTSIQSLRSNPILSTISSTFSLSLYAQAKHGRTNVASLQEFRLPREKNYIILLSFSNQSRALIKFLGAIHGNRYYHGRIREGVFIRNDQSICFTNFDVCQDLTLCEGIRKDLNDLCNMIEEALEGSIKPYEFLDFKRRVLSLPQHNDYDMLRDSTWFIYNHSLFYTNATTRGFISKLWEVYVLYNDLFRSSFRLSQDVGLWRLHVPKPTPLTTTKSSRTGSSQAQGRYLQSNTPLKPTPSKYWNDMYYFKIGLDNLQSPTNEPKTSRAEKFLIFSRNALEHPIWENKEETLVQYKLLWEFRILWLFEGLEDVMQTMLNLEELLLEDAAPFQTK